MLRARPRRPSPPEGEGLVEPRPAALRARRAKKWRLAAIGGGAALAIAGGALAFGPIVRARVDSEAARRHLEVTVGHVRPGFFAVALEDVDVRPAGVPGVNLRLDRVRVELTAGLSVREISARGGAISVDGEPGELADRLRALRGSGGSGAAPAKHRLALVADDLSLAWRMPSGGTVDASGLHAARDDDGLHLRCDLLNARQQSARVELRGGLLDLGPGGVLRRAKAEAVTLGYEPPRAEPSAHRGKAAGPDPTPPPLPLVPARPHDERKKAAEPSAPALPLPDLHALRGRLAVIATALGERVPDGGAVQIAGLSANIVVGGEPVSFGPGPLTLERHADTLHVTFASDKGATNTPLSFDVTLPVRSGDVTARLSGGPVSLALLGVKEGTMGLYGVARGNVSGKGQLVLSAAGDALTYDGRVSLASIGIKNPRLSSEPIADLGFAVSARGVLDDDGKLRIDTAELDMGALHMKTHGTIEETPDHFALALGIDVAPAACQSLLDSAPEGLLPTVRSARMAGTFGATSRVEFDTRHIDKLVLDYKVDDGCRITEVPRALSRERFTEPFSYRTYHPDGTPSETGTGPGTLAWTPLDAISPYMVAAVLTTEDGAFYKHHGFNHGAIRSSVAANLKARRFVRGASTITMQLAKNLFLSREKTLSRKVEEVILTDYLEQIFRKDDMMELYLNVIEFGPDVYGVRGAAEYYFARTPGELNLAECFFLATLLPSPVRYGKLRDKGEATEGWMRHLHALMEIAHKRGTISDAELEQGLAEPVVFVREGDPRPEPRAPISGVRRDPYAPAWGEPSDDAAWQPLE